MEILHQIYGGKEQISSSFPGIGHGNCQTFKRTRGI